jgi:hypothetical protein
MTEEDKDPLPSAFDPVTFVGDGAGEAKPASVAGLNIQQAEAAAKAKPVKVKVKAPFRVVHEATPHVGGDVVEVPCDIADAWIAKNWAEPVSAARTTKEK